jgi:hypothetical protein
LSLATDLLPCITDIRGIPGELGIRPHRVYLVQTASSGTFIGDGTILSSEHEIVEGSNQPPKVRQANDEERALGGLAAGALNIGPITPPSGAIGTTLAQLNGSSLQSQTDTLRVRIVGPLGNNEYRLASKTLHSATKWMLMVEPVGDVAL